MAAHSEYCETCGQLIKPPETYGSGRSLSSRIGIGISILLHVIAALYFMLRSDTIVKVTQPKRESAMVYIAPPSTKPLSKPLSEPKKTKPVKEKVKPPTPQKPVTPRNAPREQPVEKTFTPPVVATMKVPPPPPQQDMESMIAARRKAREDAQPPAPPQAPAESDNDRAIRIAKANIAGAQGRNSGADSDDSGGVFSIVDQTSFSATIKFRGWNTNFKRNWLKEEKVDIGSERDIETAIVKKMIQLIRQEKPGDFVWESRRLGRNIPMSARVEDTAELQAFLLQEFFPNYRRAR